jgi:catechol 2,3-dioxygenase-like lactoylglutathione lyase family enzyme
MQLDHAAFPCFDVGATHAFYTHILGLPLAHAQTGSAEVWGAESYLLLGFRLADGGLLDFFAVDGLTRPPDDGLPKDIRHVALTVATRDEVRAHRARLEEARVAHWTETHTKDDLHVYVTDPNGIVLEILAEEDSGKRVAPDEPAANAVVAAWVASRVARRA